ncbi:enoyl-CoA hydratase [Lysinibacillus sp. 3P01SB]|uniref:enoyl-CoA hydratase n=1 Tax=Lysinibacillus sp. 3P01SB TaxID=3132284 RepID=UPI0039A5D0D1
MEKVLLHIEEGIATITINNPPMNILDADVVNGLLQVTSELRKHGETKIVILTGQGTRAFMAGGDIKSFPDLIGNGEEVAYRGSKFLQEPLDAIMNLPHPTICVLNGLALGGGCELSLSCDFRIAEEHVEIGLPEVKLGLFPGAGGTQRLPRLIGVSKAKELIFTGDPVPADKALEIGLVNEVVKTGEGLQAAYTLARKMSRHSAKALQYVKLAIDEGLNVSLEEGLEIEARYFGKVFQTEDVKEGVSAFIEKRQAVFRDR